MTWLAVNPESEAGEEMGVLAPALDMAGTSPRTLTTDSAAREFLIDDSLSLREPITLISVTR
jgi:hypothetical protein